MAGVLAVRVSFQSMKLQEQKESLQNSLESHEVDDGIEVSSSDPFGIHVRDQDPSCRCSTTTTMVVLPAQQ
jgi:hypothetical protein